MNGLVVVEVTVLHCSAVSENRVSLCSPAWPLQEKWVTETGSSRERVESNSRLLGAGGRGGESVSMRLVVSTSCCVRAPRLRVSLSPPTDTKVALLLSPISLGGESPVAMLGFFRGLITPLRSFAAESSQFFMSALFSSSAFNKLFL